MLLKQLFDALESNNLTLFRMLKNYTSLFPWQMKSKANLKQWFHVLCSFLKHYKGMNQKLRALQTIIWNYSPKSWVESEIFQTQSCVVTAFYTIFWDWSYLLIDNENVKWYGGLKRPKLSIHTLVILQKCVFIIWPCDNLDIKHTCPWHWDLTMKLNIIRRLQ